MKQEFVMLLKLRLVVVEYDVNVLMIECDGFDDGGAIAVGGGSNC